MPFRIRRAVLAATAMLPAALLSSALPARAAPAEPVRVYAAGSLRAVLGEIATAYEAAQGTPVVGTFGASGLLKERLEKGEAADVFASANMDHPLALHAAGLAGPVRAFTRNTLCALTRPGLTVDSDKLLDRMLDPAVRLGTSTPKNDPAGDYAWELFAKADRLRPGSGAALDAKAIKVTGGPQAPQPPEGRNAYVWLMERNAADLILTYCTNARLATGGMPALGVVAVPEALSVGAEYGITVLAKGDTERGRGFVDFVLSPPGQTILQRHGFQPPAR